MSKIAIIGATGRAGSQLLEEALRRGHSVTAIARNASKKLG
ncbi:NmrA family NAD(P)-binding protein, partial [Pseudomonas marginalis]